MFFMPSDEEFKQYAKKLVQNADLGEILRNIKKSKKSLELTTQQQIQSSPSTELITSQQSKEKPEKQRKSLVSKLSTSIGKKLKVPLIATAVLLGGYGLWNSPSFIVNAITRETIFDGEMNGYQVLYEEGIWDMELFGGYGDIKLQDNSRNKMTITKDGITYIFDDLGGQYPIDSGLFEEELEKVTIINKENREVFKSGKINKRGYEELTRIFNESNRLYNELRAKIVQEKGILKSTPKIPSPNEFENPLNNNSVYIPDLFAEPLEVNPNN